MSKTCSKCKEEKDIDCFCVDEKRKDGRNPICRDCAKLVWDAYVRSGRAAEKRKRRQDKINEQARLRYTPEKARTRREDLKARMGEHLKAYQKNYTETHKNDKEAYDKEYRKQHRAQRREYLNRRRRTDPLYRLTSLLRSRVRNAMKALKENKSTPTLTFLGCSVAEVVGYLGACPEGSTLDHICPCAQAQNEEELLRLQHFSNLRWMEGKANTAKKDSKTPEGEALCKKLLGREWIEKKRLTENSICESVNLVPNTGEVEGEDDG